MNPDPSHAITVGFSGFSAVPGTQINQLFFHIDPTSGGGGGFDSGALSNTTTSVTIPADALDPNTQYGWELIYDARLEGLDSSSGVFIEQLFDMRTFADFTTGPVAAPEPTTFALLGVGLLGLGVLTRRRKIG